ARRTAAGPRWSSTGPRPRRWSSGSWRWRSGRSWFPGAAARKPPRSAGRGSGPCRRGAGHRAEQRPQKDALILNPLQILVSIEVPGTDVAECLRAVEGLASLVQVQSRRWIVQRHRDAHAHAADRIDDAHEAAEADAHVVVDAQARYVLHGLVQQSGTAERVRG